MIGCLPHLNRTITIHALQGTHNLNGRTSGHMKFVVIKAQLMPGKTLVGRGPGTNLARRTGDILEILLSLTMAILSPFPIPEEGKVQHRSRPMPIEWKIYAGNGEHSKLSFSLYLLPLSVVVWAPMHDLMHCTVCLFRHIETWSRITQVRLRWNRLVHLFGRRYERYTVRSARESSDSTTVYPARQIVDSPRSIQ
jgi:hypothetical protein